MPRSRRVTIRSLNRALLERQMLLHRRRIPPLDAVEHLVALQAQVPRDPYVALWSRLDPFRPEALSGLIADRRAVRMTHLRGTLHLVTARDARTIRPTIQPVIERTIHGSSPLRRAVGSVSTEELLHYFRQLLEEEPRTRAELVRAATERWPGCDAESLGYAMYLLPTVQTTPRGLWRRQGRSAFTTLDHWLGAAPTTATTPGELVLRYLKAFGPASPADAQVWSGLTRLREVFDELRPRLRVLHDEDGRELFDVPRGRLPDPGTPAPVRFLPEYDNAVIGFKDRGRLASAAVPAWTEIAWGPVLVDGFAAARWKLDEVPGRAILRIEPFRRLSRTERVEVEDEGRHLAAFLAAGAERHEVRIQGTRR